LLRAHRVGPPSSCGESRNGKAELIAPQELPLQARKASFSSVKGEDEGVWRAQIEREMRRSRREEGREQRSRSLGLARGNRKKNKRSKGHEKSDIREADAAKMGLSIGLH
jgi:hypothetical protein